MLMMFTGSNNGSSAALDNQRDLRPGRATEGKKSNEEGKAMLHSDALHAPTPYAWIDALQVPNTDPYAPRPQRSIPHGTGVDRAAARAMVDAGSMPVALYVQMFGVDRQKVMPVDLDVQSFDIDCRDMSCLDQVEH
jgi:hypothetical protein